MRAFVISSVLLVFIWRPISAQTFTELSIPAGLTGGSYYATGQLVDIDNDGDMDVTLSASDHGLTIYYNNNLDFSSYVTFDNLKTERQFLSAIDLGDFNRDGKIDILSRRWAKL
ncbi:MAG: VCBS repeat-containing protein [Bacteroidota bacterium]